MVLLSNPKRAREDGIYDAGSFPDLRPKIELAGKLTPLASLNLQSITTPSKPLRRDWLAREAALLAFCDPWHEKCSRLRNLPAEEWTSLLRWLDFSGLALYFLDRLSDLECCDLLPSTVLTRLNRNMIDNARRTHGLISESIAIQREFQDAGLLYSNLKGLSLWPMSVPKPEFRSQFDLDFLVAEQYAPQARRILDRRGYRLYAISGRSWEFKLNERPGFSLKDLYRDLRSYAVELHIEPRARISTSPLSRLEWRELRGLKMPVLSPVDLLMGQSLHVFKHVCGEFSRASHLLEFRRHVIAHRDRSVFWDDLQRAARESPQASLGLGVVTLLITIVMGDFAPEALTRWTVPSLPPLVRLWVETYSHRIALGSHPGSKLYLLLQRELKLAGVPPKRSVRLALLPLRLPPPVIRAFPNEALEVRIRRYCMQLELILLRLHFHIVEGFRYALESNRWRRMRRVAQ